MAKKKDPSKLRPLETFDSAEKKLKQIFITLSDDIVDQKQPVMKIPVRTASKIGRAHV